MTPTPVSFAMFALSLAVSLDSFVVGTTYGIRNIRIPFPSLLVIAGCSGLTIYLTMLTGGVFLSWLPLVWAERLGAGMLCVVGLWAIWNVSSYRLEKKSPSASNRCAPEKAGTDSNPVSSAKPFEKTREDVGKQEEAKTKVVLEIRPFGLVIQILKKPVKADIDASGTIAGKEAVLLGLALSLDSLGAGLGAAMLGFTPWLTAFMIVLMSAGFLLAGLASGRKASGRQWVKRFSVLPGLVLILLGVLKMI